MSSTGSGAREYEAPLALDLSGGVAEGGHVVGFAPAATRWSVR